MKKFGAYAFILLIGASQWGCVSLDKYNALDRAHRTLQETLAETRQELADAQRMLAQKDTQIEALNEQLRTKSEALASLNAENASLRTALAEAQEILKKMAQPMPPVQIAALPAQLDQALKEFAAQYPDMVEYDSEKGAIRWKSDLLFPLGSDQLANSGEVAEALNKFAEIVQSAAAQEFDVIVIGHTDTTPIVRPETLKEHKTNWHLSAHRAIAVMKMLANDGVSQQRMGIMGYGEYRPVSSDKAKNRRVEIYLVRKGSVQSMSEGIYKADDQGLVFVRPTELIEQSGS